MLRAGAAGSLLIASLAWDQTLAAQESPVLQPYSLERSAVVGMVGPGKETYSIMMAWPDGDPPPLGWPVLYILDGEDNFATFALAARRFARARARSGIAPGIVVGIPAGPLERRVRDYTPMVPDYHIPADRPASGLQTGGADAFVDFIAREVMPMVHRRWPVDRKRETFAGHSFGGLLALHAMLTRPTMADRIVAVSPSLWFGEGFLIREAAKARNVPPDALLIVTGEGERGAADAARAFTEHLPATFRDRSRLVDLPGQSHGTTMLAALPRIMDEAFGTEKP